MKLVPDPPSAEIAAQLQAANALLCEHGRNPCYSRCGVRRATKVRIVSWQEQDLIVRTRVEHVPQGDWTVIPKDEREQWWQAIHTPTELHHER